MPIERLNLSARTLNCLKRAKINKAGEVLEKSHEELLKIKNFGDKSLAELYDRLRALGLLSRIQGAEGKAEPATERQPEPEMETAGASLQTAAAQARSMVEPERNSRLRDLSALRALLGEENAKGKSADNDS